MNPRGSVAAASPATIRSASVSQPRRLRGVVRPPGDKSVSHRAAILNAIAHGAAAIENFATGADFASTLRVLSALGIHIERSQRPGGGGEILTVHGAGALGLQEPADVLDAGNSGTTIRLMSGLLAGRDFPSVLTGDDSLRSRPMGRIIEPLSDRKSVV